jgi:hypothetical protein
MMRLPRSRIRPRLARFALAVTSTAIAAGALGCGARTGGRSSARNSGRNVSSVASAVASPPPSPPTDSPARAVAFDYVGQSWMRVPARVADGPEVRMMVDTGIGVTLLTPEACERAGCVTESVFRGRRMSGQEVEITIARVRSITVAGHRVENARVAVFGDDSIIHRDLGVVGIAGLDLFRHQPVTFDHSAMRVVLETPASLAAREAAGLRVGVRVEHDGPSTVVFLPLDLAPGTRAEMEVDSGSLHMILDDRFMAALGIDRESPDLLRKEGRDETGHPFTRRYGKLPAAAHVAGASDVHVPAGATVMFQSIIHDGLLGQEFLRRHVVTFDLEKSAMTFAR